LLVIRCPFANCRFFVKKTSNWQRVNDQTINQYHSMAKFVDGFIGGWLVARFYNKM